MQHKHSSSAGLWYRKYLNEALVDVAYWIDKLTYRTSKIAKISMAK